MAVGVGGGTIYSLCKKMVKIKNFDQIVKLSNKGSLENIDLTIGDIFTKDLGTLSKDITACNFGKMNTKASKADIVLGILNLIFETIGVMAAFGAKTLNTNIIVVTGNVAQIPFAKSVFAKIEKLHDVRIIIPNDAAYATVIGAVISYNKK